MLLCECDELTLKELRTWALEQELKPNCLGCRVAQGDWRQTFQRGGWESDDLTVLSFDPDMFNRHGSANARNMTPSDLALVAKTIEPVTGALLVQLSTYECNDDNGQVEVERAVRAGLEEGRLQLVTVVRTDGRMMSLILARGCDASFVGEVAELPSRFDQWFARLKASEWIASQPNRRLHPTAATSLLPPLPPLPRGRRG
jgi:hypothetical protein